MELPLLLIQSGYQLFLVEGFPYTKIEIRQITGYFDGNLGAAKQLIGLSLCHFENKPPGNEKFKTILYRNAYGLPCS